MEQGLMVSEHRVSASTQPGLHTFLSSFTESILRVRSLPDTETSTVNKVSAPRSSHSSREDNITKVDGGRDSEKNKCSREDFPADGA